MEIYPEEKQFEFAKELRCENIAKWIEAIAKIPLTNCSCVTFNSIKEFLIDKYKAKSNNRYEIILPSGFIVNTGLFEDQNFNETEYCFAILFYPFDVDSDLYVYFKHGNIAYFNDADFEYTEMLNDLHIKSGKDITWQEAYDAMGKIAEYEQKSVPTFSDDVKK